MYWKTVKTNTIKLQADGNITCKTHWRLGHWISMPTGRSWVSSCRRATREERCPIPGRGERLFPSP
jgi:hypothetical protein